jgi:dolichol-phosphate mannosyltransferase
LTGESPGEPSRLYLLVPVLNESPNIPRLLANIRQLAEELRGQMNCSAVFVDDGSTDDTAHRIQQGKGPLAVEVLRHDRNLGPGRAFATGFAHLASRLRGEDWVVTMEGDNTSRVETLKQMLVRRREGFEVVLASPYMYGGGMTNNTLLRVFLSHGANTLIKELLGIRGILTMSSFFRLYSAPVLRRLQARWGPAILETTGFECMVELLAKLIHVEATISEVAMTLDGSQRAGRSKMRILRTIRGYLRLFWVGRKWPVRQAALPGQK